MYVKYFRNDNRPHHLSKKADEKKGIYFAWSNLPS